jgi:hypothetical protein
VTLQSPAALTHPTLRILERGWLSSNNVIFLDDDKNAPIFYTGGAGDVSPLDIAQ